MGHFGCKMDVPTQGQTGESRAKGRANFCDKNLGGIWIWRFDLIWLIWFDCCVYFIYLFSSLDKRSKERKEGKSEQHDNEAKGPVKTEGRITPFHIVCSARPLSASLAFSKTCFIRTRLIKAELHESSILSLGQLKPEFIHISYRNRNQRMQKNLSWRSSRASRSPKRPQKFWEAFLGGIFPKLYDGRD